MKSLNSVIQDLSKESLYLLNIIQKNGPLTINNLTEILNYNRNRIQRIMQPLLDEKLVVTDGSQTPTGGRLASLYDINSSDFFVAGMSIGSVRYSVFIVNLKGNRIISKQYTMTPHYTPREFAELTYIELQKLCKETNISYENIIGMGIGITGAIKKAEGILYKQHSDFFHKSWIHAPVRKLFSDIFHLPIEFDLNIYGETLDNYYYGVGRESKRLMLVSCSMSIVNGFIGNGKLTRSLNDNEDALAHMTVDMDGVLCRCGNYGCINCYSSVQAIINKFKSQVKVGMQTSIQKDIEDITIFDITSAARAQDALAKNVIEYAATILACGLANYIRLLNPDMVVLLGMVIDESDLYYETLVKTVKQRLSFDANELKIKFVKEKKVNQVFSDSAAILFIEQLLNPNEELIPRFPNRNINGY